MVSQKTIKRGGGPFPASKPVSGALKIRLGEAVAALEPLALLISNPVPVAAIDMHLLVRLFTVLKNHPDIAGAETARLSAAKKHGSANAPGRLIVPPEKVAAFLAEYAPVANKEIELPIAKLPSSVLAEAPKMTGAQVSALALFIE